MITLSQFQQMIPTNREPEIWFDIAIDFFEKYDITTVNRIAGFMAQCGHESQDFRTLEENLNYSVENLLRVFPRYFGKNKANPNEYARNPEKLANYVYMDVNRSKSGALGNVNPGDGWKFRGGGIKQLTGRNNYATFGRDIGMSADEAADYVRTKKGAFESACWFWKKNGIARFADSDDIVGMSKRVNGGEIGLADRKARYTRAKSILAGSADRSKIIKEEKTTRPTVTQNTYPTIRRGARSDVVRRVQSRLGIDADGIFGLQTEIAVRSWQRNNKYTADGILNDTQIKRILGE